MLALPKSQTKRPNKAARLDFLGRKVLDASLVLEYNAYLTLMEQSNDIRVAIYPTKYQINVE